MNKKKIIIDTDPGQDDALAIMFLVKSGMFDIQAITTVAGNSVIQNTTNNARFILDLLKSDIPLYSGAEKPLFKDLVLANVHGGSGLDGADITKKEPLNGKAVEKIIEIVKQHPNEVSIVMIGPQTNIAKAFQQDPELPGLVKELIIMGGAIEVPGNKNRVAEFNIFVDPVAAKIVFEAPVRKVLVPLDICNRIPLFLSDFEKIKRSLRKPILSMMKKYIDALAKFENQEGALVYDALAAYFLIRPEAYTLEDADILVETKGEYTDGMTVREKRVYKKKNVNVQLVNKVNREMFVSDFLNFLSR